MRLGLVITTIQAPTQSMKLLSSRMRGHDAQMFVVGDKKGPAKFELEGCSFLSLEAQNQTVHRLARLSPVGHYTRKNIGYLEAIGHGVHCIYETDDDNAPLDAWDVRDEFVEALRLDGKGWVNVYRCFTKDRIWPRGMPLDEIVSSMSVEFSQLGVSKRLRAPIQQGLANGAPDVDAVWRLVLDRPFDFDDGPSVVLSPGAWCPFNSQSTWWWPEVFPLLYLPSYCSFRMTDIWRSFVAQRCLWELGLGVVFHAPEVLQDRNLHSLMRDFHDEIPGYERNRELVQILADTTLIPGPGSVSENLQRCYEALVKREFFCSKELELLDAWRSDLERVLRGS